MDNNIWWPWSRNSLKKPMQLWIVNHQHRLTSLCVKPDSVGGYTEFSHFRQWWFLISLITRNTLYLTFHCKNSTGIKQLWWLWLLHDKKKKKLPWMESDATVGKSVMLQAYFWWILTWYDLWSDFMLSSPLLSSLLPFLLLFLSPFSGMLNYGLGRCLLWQS